MEPKSTTTDTVGSESTVYFVLVQTGSKPGNPSGKQTIRQGAGRVFRIRWTDKQGQNREINQSSRQIQRGAGRVFRMDRQQGQNQEINQSSRQIRRGAGRVYEIQCTGKQGQKQGNQAIAMKQMRDSLAKTHKTIWQRTSESGQV